ncbi:hypothetical protein C8Q74DRAFT_1373486 [Fomes fomentarius]|nr:hypothetical protein C8Q74DRAFT_1373486 [Fomes fomentarius]
MSATPWQGITVTGQIIALVFSPQSIRLRYRIPATHRAAQAQARAHRVHNHSRRPTGVGGGALVHPHSISFGNLRPSRRRGDIGEFASPPSLRYIRLPDTTPVFHLTSHSRGELAEEHLLHQPRLIPIFRKLHRCFSKQYHVPRHCPNRRSLSPSWRIHVWSSLTAQSPVQDDHDRCTLSLCNANTGASASIKAHTICPYSHPTVPLTLLALPSSPCQAVQPLQRALRRFADGNGLLKQSTKTDEWGGIKFGIFVLRDLKANEEVLGSDWGDENVASTFTTCACSPKARDCVLARIAEFVENQTPLTPSSSPPPRFTKEKYGTKGHGKPEQAEGCPIVGPLIGIERGFQRIPFACGMGGIELVFEAGPPRLATVTPSPTLSSMLLLRRRRASIVKAKDALTRTIVIVGVTIELVHALDLTPKLPSRLWRSTII